MVVGIGIDLVDVARFRAAMRRHGARLEQRLFTEGELADCAPRADRVLALAARFAAKEACVKALGTGEGIRFRDIEVVRSATGAPTLRLHGGVSALASRAGVARSHLSLTHEATAAAAVVVLETDGVPAIRTDP
jgi:holo-[acyl-carrier protein] synthase